MQTYVDMRREGQKQKIKKAPKSLKYQGLKAYERI